MDPAIDRVCRPPTERKAKAKARAVGASLLKRAEQVPAWEAATFILDFDEDTVSVRTDPQRDGRSRSSELEGVLQQVDHHRREHVSVRLNGQAIVHWLHHEREALRIGRQFGGRHEFFDKRRREKALSILHALGEPDVSKAACINKGTNL